MWFKVVSRKSRNSDASSPCFHRTRLPLYIRAKSSKGLLEILQLTLGRTQRCGSKSSRCYKIGSEYQWRASTSTMEGTLTQTSPWKDSRIVPCKSKVEKAHKGTRSKTQHWIRLDNLRALSWLNRTKLIMRMMETTTENCGKSVGLGTWEKEWKWNQPPKRTSRRWTLKSMTENPHS